GATIEPVAFIAINEKEVKLISLKEKETIWEKILKPEVGEKIYNKLMGIADAQDAAPVSTTEGEKP
ncbi:MAG TPA: GerW family sporulation protein, partial [Candidatus Rifleibacterium sp.]|nr:GerW family sporulation protein [Candidatus Rifleibacterium sp.]